MLATILALLTTSPSSFEISYGKSGGLQPTAQSLVIKPGRHGVLRTAGSRPIRFRVGPRRVKGLRRALARAGFETMESPGPTSGTCADCYSHTLRYKGHRVTFGEAFDEAEVRERLSGVLRQLNAVIAAHLPRH